jgi:hypothetical protein
MDRVQKKESNNEQNVFHVTVTGLNEIYCTCYVETFCMSSRFLSKIMFL